MEKNSRIYIAGHTGLIGSAIKELFEQRAYSNLIVMPHHQLDLTNPHAVQHFFKENQPEYVILAAGYVGGIIENQTYPADFITKNLAIQMNVLQAAHQYHCKKIIFFGSSCMYPRACPQPMPEEALLTGPVEPSSQAYAIAKLAGVQMCLAYNQQYGIQRFIPVIPNSVYGPHDNFDPHSGHVLASLIHRFHLAKQEGLDAISLWGSGLPRREFIFSSDIATACYQLLQTSQSLPLPINIGIGCDHSIAELAQKIASMVGYHGRMNWDKTKPDGTLQKLLNNGRIKTLGWQPQINLEEGLKMTYQWYLEHHSILSYV